MGVVTVSVVGQARVNGFSAMRSDTGKVGLGYVTKRPGTSGTALEVSWRDLQSLRTLETEGLSHITIT